MKYSLTNSKFQRAFGRYFCRKNYFSTNHTWEFEECQIILKKSKKEAPTVIVSACKILYSFFSGNEEYESTADDLCSFITSSLQDSHPKHPFDLDPSKKYQVVIQSWNGRFMRGLKILKDHYYSSSLSDLKNAAETLPYALPFDDKADAEKIYHQLKEEVKAVWKGLKTTFPDSFTAIWHSNDVCFDVNDVSRTMKPGNSPLILIIFIYCLIVNRQTKFHYKCI